MFDPQQPGGRRLSILDCRDNVADAILSIGHWMRAMRTKWITTVVCWDGVLPLIAVACPWLVKGHFPKGHIAEVVAAVFVPMFLALVRTALAQSTLKRYFAGRLPLFRQIALGLAIISLLVVELATALKVFAPEAPILLFVLVGWLAYVGLISAATIPQLRDWNSHERCGEQSDARERPASSVFNVKSIAAAP